jgi:hypothetical protein
MSKGRPKKYGDIELSIVEWVKQRRTLSLPVTNQTMATEVMRRFIIV